VITVQVDPFGSDTWRLDQIVDLIKNGGVGVIPTDTVYAIVCDLKHREAIDRLYRCVLTLRHPLNSN
jgi:tRNA A37 threonylcarbamoyladenosine synthetase subunit TsaC/SUA5/YrdC